MKRQALILAAAAWATSASAADNGHCDSKPFTLKKPVAATPAKPVVAVPAPKPKVASTKKYVIGCKQPKA